MSDNLPEVISALKVYTQRVDGALFSSSKEISYALEGYAKREIQGLRPKGEKATTGEPPMNRTGNLRRSIRGQGIRKGFQSYQAIVGADAEYARAVEMGSPYNPPSWKNGEHFPYLEPALQKFIRTGAVRRIITKHLGVLR